MTKEKKPTTRMVMIRIIRNQSWSNRLPFCAMALWEAIGVACASSDILLSPFRVKAETL